MRRFIALMFICGLLLTLLSGSSLAQDTDQQEQTRVQIVYTEELLVIIVTIGKNPFKGFVLEWVDLLIVNSENETTTNPSFQRYLNEYDTFERVINNIKINRGETFCLVLEKENREESYPTKCPRDKTYPQQLNPVDVFWWDNFVKKTTEFLIYTASDNLISCPGGSDTDSYGICGFDDYNIPFNYDTVKDDRKKLGNTAKRTISEITTSDSETYSKLINDVKTLIEAKRLEEAKTALTKAINNVGKQEENEDQQELLAELYKQRGDVLISDGKTEEAISDYDQAIELEPDNELYLLARGNAYLLLEEYADALSSYDSAIKLAPFDGLLYYQRSIAQYQLGLRDDAIKSLNTVINREDESIELEAFALRARVKLDQGNYRGCVDDYTQAIAIREEPYLYNNRGACWFFKENYKNALSDFEAAYELEPTNVAVIMNLGTRYLQSEQFEEAIKKYEEATEKNEESKPIQPEIPYTNLGSGYLKYAEFIQEAAIEDAELNGTDPNDERDGGGRARPEFDKAIEALEIAIEYIEDKEVDERNVERSNPYLLLARAYVGIGDFSEAINVFENALDLEGASVESQVQAYKQWSDTFIQAAQNLLVMSNNNLQGNRSGTIPDEIKTDFADYLDQAVEKIKTALDIDDGISELTSDGKIELYLKLVEIYRYRSEIQMAIDTIGTAMDFADSRELQAKLYVELGNIYRSIQNEPLARKQYLAAVDLQPDNLNYLVTLSNSYMRERRIGDAKNVFDKAIELDEDNPTIRYLLARYHIDIGEFTIAYNVLEQLKQMDPDYIQAWIAQALIDDKLGREAARDQKIVQACQIEPIKTEQVIRGEFRAGTFRFTNQIKYGRRFECE